MSYWQGKVILITGAGSGIGRALASHFAQLQARLVLTDIQPQHLQETAAPLGSQVILARTQDVRDKAQWQTLAKDIEQQVGHLDVLVNNAGVLASDPIDTMADEHFDWVLDVNLHGVIHGTRTMLPLIAKAKRGMVVNLSSIFGLIGVARMGAYNTSKFAVRGFTEALRQDVLFSDRQIDVVCVHPGGIKTNIANSSVSTHTDVPELARHFNRSALTTPAKAARIIEKGMRNRKRRILVGPDAKLVDWLQRWLPNHYDRVFNALFIPRSIFGAPGKSLSAGEASTSASVNKSP